MGLFWSYYRYGVRCYICKKWIKFDRKKGIRKKTFQEEHNELHSSFFKNSDSIKRFIAENSERILIYAIEQKNSFQEYLSIMGISLKTNLGNDTCFFCRSKVKHQLICDFCRDNYKEEISFDKIRIFVDYKQYSNHYVKDVISIVLKNKIKIVKKQEYNNEAYRIAKKLHQIRLGKRNTNSNKKLEL